MKKTEAKKCVKIIERELKKIAKKWGITDLCTVVEVVESEIESGWFGVQVRTDSTMYEIFYDDTYWRTAYKLQKQIEETINTKMGWKSGEHYFEADCGGILDFY